MTSSVGRAPGSQSGGQGFDSPVIHQPEAPIRSRRLLFVALGLLLLPVVAEALIALALAHPGLAPSSGLLLDGLRHTYLLEDWNVLQASEAMVPDPRLGYRLRPGTWRMSGREYDTELRVNSAGLRDDERSLTAPQIIVLGDSYAMGWGVAQDESFAQQLERLTGLTVLDAGIPSYGTARELMLLQQLDRSQLRAVVVQYFLNDHRENLVYLAEGPAAVSMSAEEFEANAVAHRERLAYRPFDYLRSFFDRTPFDSELEEATPETLASTALFVLSSSAELRDVPILFLEVGVWGQKPDAVSRAVAAALGSNPAWARVRERMTVLPLAERLGPQDFFVLDPHLRASGHAKIAQVVAQALRERGVLER